MTNKKKIRMSYSAAECWKTCGEKYWLKYDQRVRPLEEGASLFFGTCVDNALVFLLEAKKEGKEHLGKEGFKELFLVDKDKGWNCAFDSSQQRYGKADYDPDVFSEADNSLIAQWEKELKVSTKEVLQAEKQKRYKPFGAKQLLFYNRLCWLSLKRKGLLMLEAFEKEVFPQITKVIAVQPEIVVTNNIDNITIEIIFFIFFPPSF
jgi:hypothetical protein